MSENKEFKFTSTKPMIYLCTGFPIDPNDGDGDFMKQLVNALIAECFVMPDVPYNDLNWDQRTEHLSIEIKRVSLIYKMSYFRLLIAVSLALSDIIQKVEHESYKSFDDCDPQKLDVK